MNRKLFLFMVSLIALNIVVACSASKKETAQEVIQWSEIMSPSIAGYEDRVAVLDKALTNGLLKLPISTDAGPALYRERSQRYLLQGKSGQPDILEGTLEQVYSYIAAGLARPVDDLLDNSELNDVLKRGLRDALTINGVLYAFPNQFNVRLLVYRKDLLDKHNLSVPTTWDELINTSKILKEKEGINGFMFTTQLKEVRAFQEFMSFYFTLADNIYDTSSGEAVYIADKKNFEKVFQLYKDLFDVAIDPNFKGQDWKAVDYAVTGGDVAMVTVGPWIWEHLEEDPNREEVMNNLYVAPIPIPEGGEPGTYMEVKGLVFNPYASEEKLDAAVDVAELFTGKDFTEINVKNGSISIRDDVPIATRFAQSFGEAENVATGKVLEYINWEIPQNAIIESIQDVIYGQRTPSEAADDLEKMFIEYAPSAIPNN